MKKVLFTATVDSHILHFHMPHIQWFKEQGYEVHVASNGATRLPGVDQKFNVPFERQPLKMNSWEAYKVLKVLLDNNQYDIVHCHTPMGAVLTRFAAKNLRKEGTKVLYTAHGFHFFKGAPLQNWIIYYPIEKLLASFTDCLITMNGEDFQAAQDRKFKATEIKFVHGVGVDLERFQPPTEKQKQVLRQEYGFQQDDFVMIYVAELSPRKNQMMLIEVMKNLKEEFPQVKLLLVGKGDLHDQYQNEIHQSGLSEHIHLLGYRRDVDKLMRLSDIAVSSSRQEGLPVNVMEAMATGLPLVVTACRGNRDLVMQNINGYVTEIDDVPVFTERIKTLTTNELLKKRFGKRSIQLMEAYSLQAVMDELDVIYSTYIESDRETVIHNTPIKAVNQ